MNSNKNDNKCTPIIYIDNMPELTKEQIEDIKRSGIIQPASLTISTDLSSLTLDTLKKLQTEILKIIDKKYLESRMTFKEIYELIMQNKIYENTIIHKESWNKNRTATIKEIVFKESHQHLPIDLLKIAITTIVLENKLDNEDGSCSEEWETRITSENEFENIPGNDWEVIK